MKHSNLDCNPKTATESLVSKRSRRLMLLATAGALTLTLTALTLQAHDGAAATGLRAQGSAWLAKLRGLTGLKTAAVPAKMWSSTPNEVTAGGLNVVAKVFTSGGWVKPGEAFPFALEYRAGDAPVAGATLKLTLNVASVYNNKSSQAPVSGNGTAGSPLTYVLPALTAGQTGRIIVEARAKNLTEDPEIIWKDLSAKLLVEVAGQPAANALSHGPKVTTLPSARFGDRPFPVVMVHYQDLRRCSAVGERANGVPADECLSDHTAERLDEAVNSRSSGKSLWQLYQDMSFGQLHPIGAISPLPNSANTPFTAGYVHKFATLTPSGTCTGQTLAAAKGTPVYPNRIADGWYLLPGTQGFYGADKTGHALAGSVSGQGLLFDIDSACGPTGKIVYDAASLADPDIDYDVFDTDKDGVVDFFNLMFAGDGGNGSTTASGLNNVWPHKADVRFYFTDAATGLAGYISNDRVKNHYGELMFYTTAARNTLTTTETAFPAFTIVGPYNVNPESAVDTVSVVGHEYGHSLGLPDFYSTGSRSTFGSWELMASDHFQFMTGYTRSKLGWIVPQKLESGNVALTESKTDTGKITWKRPDGTPYTLTGEGIHNADVYQQNLPTVKLIGAVPSGERAWHSGSGNDFGCPGHTFDVYLPELAHDAYKDAAAITLKFKSLYEIEWDYDYGFVLVSTDGGLNFTGLASTMSTTIASSYNPNNSACFTKYGNAITGVSGGGANTVANPNRVTSAYPEATFIDDAYNLTAYKGKEVILRFAYSTDPGLAKRGWFIDDISVTADDKVVYSSDFEKDTESPRLEPFRWSRVSTADGVETLHAFFIELRDRINNDFDSKAQSDRGPPTFQPGISMIYSDENHGFGNTGVDSPPAQTPVDAAPQPGNESPNLDDASFGLTRPAFNSCVHIDNYADPKGPGMLWQLPQKLKFTVTDIRGLSTDGMATVTPATATLIAEVNPDCTVEVLPPTISIASGYENPDTNGRYTLAWTRPVGAVGPDRLQEATVFAALLEDDAEGGLGKWVTTTVGQGAFAWQASTAKKHGGSNSFWGRYTNGSDAAQSGNVPASLLTLKDAIAIPADGDSSLSYWDFYINEGDDLVILEASKDDGATWDIINQSARSELAPDAAAPVATEALTYNLFSLAPYKGKSIKLRFRMQSGGEDRAGSSPFGWFVDDIKVESSNFRDLLASTPLTMADIARGSGSYYYRVKTAYPAGPVTVPTDWSNVVTTTVVPGVPPPPSGSSSGGSSGGSTSSGSSSGGVIPVTPPAAGKGRFGGGAMGEGLLLMLVLAGLRRRRRL